MRVTRGYIILSTIGVWICSVQAQPVQEVESLYTIPVIFHIVHQGEAPGSGSNLSAGQIYSQIDVLNEDFRRKSGTPGFSELKESSDTRIEFCPAQLDTQGFPLTEPGIHRINANANGWTGRPYSTGFVDVQIKPTTIWNPQRYLNIWVLDLGTLDGYAQFPDSSDLSELQALYDSASTDGVVVHTTDVGRKGNLRLLNSAGRTATHEIGHWLGLVHTWGDDNGDCSGDDGCEDTPLSGGPSSGCPTSVNACGGRVMTENHMDLTAGICKNTFTLCQRNRMRQVLTVSPRRRELSYSPVCEIPQSAPQAAFSYVFKENDCKGIVQFQDETENQPFTWLWDFGDGRISKKPNPVIAYSKPGNYRVSLIVQNTKGSSSTETQINICSTPGREDLDFAQISAPYPNPATGEIVLKAEFNTIRQVEIYLMDLNGRLVQVLWKGSAPAGKFEQKIIRPHTISSGMYAIYWKIDRQTHTQKVLFN